MKRIVGWTKSILTHPVTSLALSGVLFLSGLLEAWDSFESDPSKLKLRTHHAIALYGLVGMLRAIAEIVEGAQKLVAAE